MEFFVLDDFPCGLRCGGKGKIYTVMGRRKEVIFIAKRDDI